MPSAATSSPGRALSGLTVRGRWLVVAGCLLLAGGALAGERPVVQLAVFVLALPLLAAAVVARQRFRISARRTVSPTRLPRGRTAEVHLQVANADRRTGGLWLLTEHLPATLGRSPEFVVDRLPGRGSVSLRYAVPGVQRGRHVLGPVQLRVVDPFGLVVRSAAGGETAPLIVVPRVRPLGPGGPAGGQGAGGAGARRAIAVHGEDDVSIREYRQGDDLRKVHWRASAHTGELMVRLEERPWRAQATLLLDTRTRAHLLARGRAVAAQGPAGDDDPPADTLEWLVEAAASIGVALTGRGTVLRAFTDSGELTPSPGRGGLSADDLLDRLAVVGASRVADLSTGVDLACRAAGDGPLVCLLAGVGAEDVAGLARARSGPATDVAVLVDVAGWAEGGAGRGRRPLSAAARAELTRQRDDAARLLRAAGWQVAVARADTFVEQVWSELAGPAGPRTPGMAGTAVAR